MKLTLLALLILLSSPKPNCDCGGQIKYYHRGTLVKEITFQKEYFIAGEDCAIVRGEQIRFDSIVINQKQNN